MFSRLLKRAKRPFLRANQNIRFLVWKSRNDFDVPDEPHIDGETRAVLEGLLRNAKVYFEYGSGGSTRLAARLVADRVVTIESDSKFLAAVERSIDPALRSKLDLKYIDIGLVGPWGTPIFPLHRDYRRYPQAPWLATDCVPDVIFVDGRFRLACALEALLRVPGDWAGRVVLDDYKSRPHYNVVERFAADIERHGRSISFGVGAFDREACARELKKAYRDWH